MAGIEWKKRMEIEAGTVDIKRGEKQLVPGWEWVWMEDPWTRAWERLRVPKEEADLGKEERSPPRPSYWGEAEAKSGGES